MPYYPARDGHPSMFTLDDNASAATVEPIHSTIRRAILVARPRDLHGSLGPGADTAIAPPASRLYLPEALGGE